MLKRKEKKIRCSTFQLNYCVDCNHSKCRRGELDNRKVFIFVALLFIISATVSMMYKDVLFAGPELQFKYNFSDLVK